MNEKITYIVQYTTRGYYAIVEENFDNPADAFEFAKNKLNHHIWKHYECGVNILWI